MKWAGECDADGYRKQMAHKRDAVDYKKQMAQERRDSLALGNAKGQCIREVEQTTKLMN